VDISLDERDMTHVMSHGLGGPDETYFKFSYDGGGRVTRLDTGAPAGPQRTMLYNYDGFRRLEKITDPMGNETRYAYDGLHRVIRAERHGELDDIAGNAGNIALSRSHFEYDDNGRCTATKMEIYDYPGSYVGDGLRTTTYTYDAASNLRGEDFDSAQTLTFSYDSANRLALVTDAKSNSVAFTWSARMELVSKFWTLKSDTGAPDQQYRRTYGYDALGRRTTTADNVGNTHSYAYDSRGNLVRHVDARGNHAQWEYDGLSRLTRSGRDLGGNSLAFDAGDIITLSAWDENSRLASSTNANGFATTYQYDALARRIRTNQPDGTFSTTTYDAWSRPVLATDANGTQRTHLYDDNARLVGVSIAPGPGVLSTTTNEQYAYDGAGRVIRAMNNATSVIFTYDSAGNRRTDRQGALTIAYSYDNSGRLTAATHPGGRVYSYSYDAANLLTTVALTATSDGDALGVIATNSYIGARLERVDRRNGTFTEYTYAGAVGIPVGSDHAWGCIASVTHKHAGGAFVDARTFEHDRNQNLAQRFDARLGGPGLLHRYQYDGADRHTGTQVTAGLAIVRQTNYALDLEGNRINVGGPGTPDAGAYQQNPANPPADAQQNQYTISPIAGYLYDANGNRRRSGGAGGNLGYAYDARNRLIDVTDLATGNRVVTYLYDALGRRTRRTLAPDTAPVPVNFLHAGRAVAEERDGGGLVMASYSVSGSSNSGMVPTEEVSFNSLRNDPYSEDAVRLSNYTVTSSEPATICWEIRRGGVNHAYHTAGGSTFALTDSAGAATERYDYEDYGQPHFFDGGGGSLVASAVRNPFLCKSSWLFDADTGLYSFGHGGYFDPRIAEPLQPSLQIYTFEDPAWVPLPVESSTPSSNWIEVQVTHF
jgi:YD repeat-containing protein